MICNSSLFPTEVIIVISNSGYNRKEEHNINCRFKILLYYRRGKRNSASNKNYGSVHANCPFLSYFDSDDIMAYNRIEIIYYILKNYQVDIIMHMYTRDYNYFINNNYNKYLIQNYIFFNSSYVTQKYKEHINTHIIKLWYCCNFLNLDNISNGWITISRKLFNVERFNEDKSIQRAEDSEYNGRVISKGYKSLILGMILGFYSKRNKFRIK